MRKWEKEGKPTVGNFEEEVPWKKVEILEKKNGKGTSVKLLNKALLLGHVRFVRVKTYGRENTSCGANTCIGVIWQLKYNIDLKCHGIFYKCFDLFNYSNNCYEKQIN